MEEASVLKLVSQDDIPRLVKVMRGHLPRSIKVLGSVGQMLRDTRIINGRLYVDDMDHPRVVIFEAEMRYSTAVPVQQHSIVMYATCDAHMLTEILQASHFLNNRQAGGLEFLGIDDTSCKVLQPLLEDKGFCFDIAIADFMPAHATILDPGSTCTRPLLPVGYHIGSLRKQDAPLVNKMWKYGGTERDLLRIMTSIQLSPTVGIYETETGELVCWALTSRYGAIAMLQTTPQHQRKGLATAAIQYLCCELQSCVYITYAFLDDDNNKSKELFKKLGFRFFEECYFVWTQVVPK